MIDCIKEYPFGPMLYKNNYVNWTPLSEYIQWFKMHASLKIYFARDVVHVGICKFQVSCLFSKILQADFLI